MTVDSVTEFYGSRADLYDRIATAPGVGRWRRAAAARVAEPGATVVEMGCGTGANLPHLRERVGPEGRVVGVDITGPLLERARAHTAAFDNVGVVRGDARRPPIGAADAVLATFVCGMFEDPAAVVDRWCDLVGSGGRIALMNATETTEPVGRPLNPPFRAFTALSAPTMGPIDAVGAVVGATELPLTRRVSAARDALVARTVDRRYETFALGFVGLLSGRVR